MKTSIRNVGEVSIVDLPGRITHGDTDLELKMAVGSLLEEGRRRIVMNMEKVAFMDSAGLGELVACHKRVVEKGGAIRILRPNKKVLDLFTITKLISLFDIFEEEKQAIESF